MNIRKICTAILVVVGGMGVALMPTEDARAAVIQYDLEGFFALGFNSTDGADAFHVWFGGAGGRPAENYTFQLNTDTGEGRLFGELTGVVTELGDPNRVRNATPITARFELQYTGLTLGTDPVTGVDVVSIGRQGANGEGAIHLESTFLGGGLTLNIDLEDKFAFEQGGVTGQAFYGDLGLQPLNLFLGQAADGTGGPLAYKNWVMAENIVSLIGRTYSAGGDFHATVVGTSEVPEPASAALLGMALVGGVLRRKKAALPK